MRRPLRLLLVNENIGGHRTMHHHLAKSLAGRDDIEASFFHVPPPRWARRLASAPVPGMARLDADLHVLRSQLLVSAITRRELAHRRGSWDVLHVYTHNAALLSTAALAAGPSVVSLDATNADYASRLPCRHPTRFTPWAARPAVALERQVYRAATLVVAKSNWARRSLVEDYGVPEDKVRVIPFGVRLPAHVRSGPPPGRPRITFVGRTLDRKGGRRLLELWRAHLSAIATLTLVTPEPLPEEPGLEVRNDVTVANGRLDPILAATSALAFPSDADTFGYAILEAMSAGVPVVASRSAAAPELVGDGDGAGGLLVDPGDDLGLIDGLKRLATDDDLNGRLGRAARARVVAHYDAEITTSALVDVIDEAVARYRLAGRRLPRQVVPDDVVLGIGPTRRRPGHEAGQAQSV